MSIARGNRRIAVAALTLGVCAVVLLIVSLKLFNHRSSPASSPKPRASVASPSPSVSGKASAKSVAAASSIQAQVETKASAQQPETIGQTGGHALKAETAPASRRAVTAIAEQPEEIESDEKPGADEWFHEQRAYPRTEIPIAARMRALDQLDQLEREE